jgi:tRNA(fMet)-specific endonuclease VapC
MKWMLDTNICIYLIKERPASVLERFAAHPVGDLGLSTITLAELDYGVAKSTRRAKNREALEAFISPLEIAGFDRPATAAYGHIRAHLEGKGRLIGSLDLLIAAHALSLEVGLVTHSAREFGRVPGLRIEDWA